VLHHDSYKPSDLAIIRNYGGTVLAQVPLGALLKLDPYVPTEAALLRHVGGAIPLWAFGTYPWYVPAPVSGPCEPVPEARVSASAPPTLATFNDVLQAVARPSSVTSGTPRATTEREIEESASSSTGARGAAMVRRCPSAKPRSSKSG
jgi:hypothetical protein